MYRLRISTAPVGHCSHIGPYLLGYLLVVASSSVLPSHHILDEDELEELEKIEEKWDLHNHCKTSIKAQILTMIPEAMAIDYKA